MPEMLSADQAADRLGIKVPSLYAYVSRGLVERHTAADGRSMFDASSIATLASRGRPRVSSKQTSLNLLIETQITRIDSHRIFYRGHEVTELCGRRSFEEVAEMLWLGSFGELTRSWSASPVAIGTAGDARIVVPMRERLRIGVAYAAAADPFRANLDPSGVAASGRNAVATMIAALTDSAATPPRMTVDGRRVSNAVAARLWRALAGTRRPMPGMVEVLDSALVLLADHELATSTFAARVAASTRADPYAVIGTGLGVLDGPLHGRASSVARRLVDDAASFGASAAIAEALRAWRVVPGFGHPLYPAGDPRAAVLLAQLRRALGTHRSLAVADSVIDAVAARTDQNPNVDFVLAVLTHAAGMAADAGEIVFAIARTAGWLAHALEEYAEAPLRFRPRAAYVGPR